MKLSAKLSVGGLSLVGLALALFAGGSAAVPARAQGTAAVSQTGAAPAAQTTTIRRRVRRRRTTAAPASTPVQTAAPAQTLSPEQAAFLQAQQRAADAQLLREQQARSDKEAAITDRMAQRAQDRRDAQDREVRIQDGTSPAQTGFAPGVTPGVVQPVQPVQQTVDPNAVPSQQPSNTQSQSPQPQSQPQQG